MLFPTSILKHKLLWGLVSFPNPVGVDFWFNQIDICIFIFTFLSCRLRKTDNNRLARACGATIVNRTEELRESDVGTMAGKFEIKKIGDEYFTFVTECKNPKVS